MRGRPARTVAQSRNHRCGCAQNGDVEVYYDGRGRRVIVDPYTGEILAVQPARPMREYEPPRRERYYDDDPEDMARLRRDQQRDLQLREPPPEPAYPDDGYGYGRGRVSARTPIAR